jgi:hypothetical protein
MGHMPLRLPAQVGEVLSYLLSVYCRQNFTFF